MDGQTFRIDPLSGDTVWVMADGTEVGSTPEEATRGSMRYSNGTMFDVATGRIVTTLGQQGLTEIVHLPGNRFSLTSSVQRSQVNSAVSGERRYQFSGNLTVLDANGDMYAIPLSGENVNKLGKQLAVHKRDDGTEEFRPMPGQFQTNADLQAREGMDWRLATPTETIEHAAYLWLVHEYGETIEEIVKEGIDGYPNTRKNFSEAVRVLAQMAVSNAVVFSHTLYEVT